MSALGADTHEIIKDDIHQYIDTNNSVQYHDASSNDAELFRIDIAMQWDDDLEEGICQTRDDACSKGDERRA